MPVQNLRDLTAEVLRLESETFEIADYEDASDLWAVTGCGSACSCMAGCSCGSTCTA